MHRYTITRWRQRGPKDLLRVSPPSFRELWDDLWNSRWSGLVLFIALCVFALILISGASHDRILNSKEPIYRRMTTESQILGER